MDLLGFRNYFTYEPLLRFSNYFPYMLLALLVKFRHSFNFNMHGIKCKIQEIKLQNSLQDFNGDLCLILKYLLQMEGPHGCNKHIIFQSLRKFNAATNNHTASSNDTLQ